MSGLTRRSFITGAALGGAALAGTVLTGCSSPTKVDTDKEERLPGAETAAESGNLFTAPTPITDIAETEETDILVIGAGIAGVCCALSSIEAGAKVTVLQKSDAVKTTGNGVCCYNVPEAMEQNGLEYVDFSEKIIELNNGNSGGSNFPLLKKFFDNEVEAITWFLGETKDVGVPPEGYVHPNGKDPCLMWLSAETEIIGVATKLAEKAEKLGAVFHFSTPAIQLVTDNTGAVTGAIAQREDGASIQVNASKGVVLAAGDYSNNKELRTLWCPATAELTPWPFAERNGDGILMAIWAGAAIAPYPHTKMVHNYPHQNSAAASKAWLATDLYGNRVYPEDLAFDWICNAMLGHKDSVSIKICDANFSQQLEEMGYPVTTQEEMDQYIENGWVVSADTIEELALLANMEEGNSLVATVERYNELVEQESDTDFYKDSKYLKEIKTPPFYANHFDQYILAIPSGLQVNADCAVMGADNKLIEGLYAIGNCQGGMYGGTDYPFAVNCGSTGRGVVFGYLLGLELSQ